MAYKYELIILNKQIHFSAFHSVCYSQFNNLNSELKFNKPGKQSKTIPEMVSVKRRLRTADCRPGVKCRLSVKCRLQTESKTQAGVKCRPSINCSRGRV